MNRAYLAHKASMAVEGFRSSRLRYADCVLQLSEVVSAVEGGDLPTAGLLRRTWGQLEIINALALDEGVEVVSPDTDVDDLLERFLSLLPPEDDDEGRDEGFV